MAYLQSIGLVGVLKVLFIPKSGKVCNIFLRLGMGS